jgi:hypothetical protein
VVVVCFMVVSVLVDMDSPPASVDVRELILRMSAAHAGVHRGFTANWPSSASKSANVENPAFFAYFTDKVAEFLCS